MADRHYNEVLGYSTYEERLKYLRLNSKIGMDTFGFDRYLNQQFYHSAEWRKIRDQIIVRDNGCDLACPDRPIAGKIYIHHINPITIADLNNAGDILLNPDFLICCSLDTHNAIHYGSSSSVPMGLVERRPNDTCPWKH